jgi:hypothetical protein
MRRLLRPDGHRAGGGGEHLTEIDGVGKELALDFTRRELYQVVVRRDLIALSRLRHKYKVEESDITELQAS